MELSEKQKQAIALLDELTGGTRDPQLLDGKQNQFNRQTIIEGLIGRRVRREATNFPRFKNFLELIKPILR